MRLEFLYYSVIVCVFVCIIIYYTDIDGLIEIKLPLSLCRVLSNHVRQFVSL